MRKQCVTVQLKALFKEQTTQPSNLKAGCTHFFIMNIFPNVINRGENQPKETLRGRLIRQKKREKKREEPTHTEVNVSVPVRQINKPSGRLLEGILPRSPWVSVLLSCSGCWQWMDGWMAGWAGWAGGWGRGSRTCAHVCEHVPASTPPMPSDTPGPRRGERAEPWLTSRGNASLALPAAQAW